MEYKGIYDCLKKILIEEGPLAFYKGNMMFYIGTVVPLLGVALLVSLQFGTNELSKKFMKQFSDN